MEEVAKRRGKPFEHVLRGALERVNNGGKPTEEMERESERERVARVEKELSEMKEARAREEKEAREAYAAQQEAALIEQYRSAVRGTLSPDHHPMLMTLDADEIMQRTLGAADYIAGETGIVPDPAEILAELERDEVQKFEARAAKAGYSRAQIEAAVDEAKEDAERQAVINAGSKKLKEDMKQVKNRRVQFDGDDPDLHVREADGKVRTPGQALVRPPMGNRDAAEAGGGDGKPDWRNMTRRERIERAGKEVFGKRA